MCWYISNRRVTAEVGSRQRANLYLQITAIQVKINKFNI